MEGERLNRDQLVELRDQYSDVYPVSPTGARGWVRAKRELPKSDPEVYIEWDKTHWRWHGEKDGWTFEHHFRPVKDDVVDLHHHHQEASMEAILADAHRKLDADRCPDCGSFHDSQGEFIDTLVEANDACLGADGYFVIALRPRKVGELTVFEPEIFTHSLTDTARKMLEAQLVYMASQIFEGHMISQVSELEGREGELGR